MSKFCFLNGAVVPVEDAKISINDIGLLRGYAAFDYMRTYHGKPFRIEDHLVRFRSSAAALRLPVKYSDDEIRSIVAGLLAKSTLKGEAGIRFILTGGCAGDSMSVGEPNFIIAIEDLPEYPKAIFEEGVKLVTYEFLRNLPTSKTTEYMTAVKLQELKKQKNVFDILYCFEGEVLEVTRNNFFIFKDDVLITPKDNVLLGITRKVILELAADHFKVEERKLLMEELPTADEAFLCGTSKKIVPVVQVDDHVIAEGKPGNKTRKLMDVFEEYVETVGNSL